MEQALSTTVSGGMGKNSMSLLVHVYYPGSWKIIREKCRFLLGKATNIIVTVCHDDVLQEIEGTDAVVLRVTNVGKDIGGKLVGLQYYLKFCPPTEFLVFLHDKVSPQSLNAGFWLDQLYSVFQERKLMRVLDLLQKRRKIGITGAKLFLKNEYVKYQRRFNSTNHSILMKLMDLFGIKASSHNYIGGTMFIARSEIFSRFFSQHSPLEIRERLERGNVLDLEHGTYTHSWERLFCFIANAQGYEVKGV